MVKDHIRKGAEGITLSYTAASILLTVLATLFTLASGIFSLVLSPIRRDLEEVTVATHANAAAVLAERNTREEQFHQQELVNRQILSALGEIKGALNIQAQGGSR